MPVLVGVCPQCMQVRYKSKVSFEPAGPKPTPQDFEGVNGQPDPEGSDASKPAFCFECGKGVVFTPEPVPTKSDDDYDAMKQRALQTQGQPVPDLTKPSRVLPSSLPLTTLFEAKPGENIVSVKELMDMKYIFITSQRVVMVDLTKFQ